MQVVIAFFAILFIGCLIAWALNSNIKINQNDARAFLQTEKDKFLIGRSEQEIRSFYGDEEQTVLMIDKSNNEFIVVDGANKDFFSGTISPNNIRSVELVKNGHLQISGNTTGAAIGGVLFGATGAVIGGSGSRNISDKCTSLFVRIKLKNSEKAFIDFHLIRRGEYDLRSNVYINSEKNAISALNIIEDLIETVSDDNKKSLEKIDVEDFKIKIEKLSELCKSGLITDEEFEKKKEEILSKI